jgi:hypothetical protein
MLSDTWQGVKARKEMINVIESDIAEALRQVRDLKNKGGAIREQFNKWVAENFNPDDIFKNLYSKNADMVTRLLMLNELFKKDEK